MGYSDKGDLSRDLYELEDILEKAEQKKFEEWFFPKLQKLEAEGAFDWNKRKSIPPSDAKAIKGQIEKAFKEICSGGVIGSDDLKIDFKFFDPFYSGAKIELTAHEIVFAKPDLVRSILASGAIMEIFGKADGRTCVSFEFMVRDK